MKPSYQSKKVKVVDFYVGQEKVPFFSVSVTRARFDEMKKKGDAENQTWQAFYGRRLRKFFKVEFETQIIL